MRREKLAIIGASYLQLPLVVKAKQLGIYTICFAWPKGAVCKEVADEFYPISIVEKDQILSICRNKGIDGVCTIASDVAAPTVAYVAEHMNLPGNNYSASVKANNKYLMREAFSSAGINCPKFKKVSYIKEKIGFDWNYPLIVKPCDRSGSLGVCIVQNSQGLEEGLKKAIDLSFCHEAIVEEYIDGREVSVEFISYQGKHYPLAITDKVTTGAPHFVELAHHQPADLPKEICNKLFGETKKALDSLGITDGASHSEYKITSDGQIFIIELGARMGGDFIGSDLVYLSTGFDYLKGVIDVALAKFQVPVFSGELKSSGVYFLCKETQSLFDYIVHKKVPGTVRSEITDSELRSVTCSSDRSGYLIYQSNKKLILPVFDPAYF